MILICIFTILIIPGIICDIDIECESQKMDFDEVKEIDTCIPASFLTPNETESAKITNGNVNIQGFYVKNSNSTYIPHGLSTSLPSLKYFVFKESKLTQISMDSLKNLNDLIEVNFYRNFLTKIENGIFLDNQKLQKIILSDNKIKNIDNCTFSGLKDLQEVHLNDNELTTLEPGLFLDNHNLTVIKLQMNAIKKLPVSLFHGLSKLNTVTLDYNELTTLPDRMFVDCEKLEVFTVSYNLIKIIGAENLNIFESLKNFQIDNNECTESSETNDWEKYKENCKATCEIQIEWLLEELKGIRDDIKCLNVIDVAPKSTTDASSTILE